MSALPLPPASTLRRPPRFPTAAAAILRVTGLRLRDGPSLAAFWGAPQDAEELTLSIRTGEPMRLQAPPPARRASA
jgi:hypothetical protein